MPYDTRRYVVRNVRVEAPRISTLFLTEQDGTIPGFEAGQLIDVYFPDTGNLSGKPYSISSAPGGSLFSITVHAIGEFSDRLCAMKEGGTVQGSLPYGFFRPKGNDTDLVLLAAGMGVSPFYGLARHLLSLLPSRRISLFHSARGAHDLIFRRQFDVLRDVYRNIGITYFVTREKTGSGEGVFSRRMRMEDVQSQVHDVPRTEALVCGSFSFVQDMRKNLLEIGILKHNLRTSCISPLSGVFCV